MGLFTREDSKFWQMRFSQDGKKVRISTNTTNKRLAQKIYDRTRWEIAQGTYNPHRKTSLPFFELVDEFLDKHSRIEKASYKRDEVIGEALKKYFGMTPIGEIYPYDIKEWRKWRMEHVTRKGTPIKKASVNRELAFLKTMFNLAVEWRWLEENPAEKIRLLKGEEKRMRILTRTEIDKLISESPAHLKPMLIMAIATGMRRGEILNLMKKHVDFANGFVRVVNSKNGDSRDVPVDSYVLKVLEELTEAKKTDDFVFCWKNGKRIKCVKEAFKAACERAGIEDFRFHDLRHAAASLLAAGGCDIITLQNILGHKTLSMTQRYAHLIPGRHDRTREITKKLWQKRDTKTTRSSDRADGRSVSH